MKARKQAEDDTKSSDSDVTRRSSTNQRRERKGPIGLTGSLLLQLQRDHGNQAVKRLLRGGRSGIEIGETDDRYEQEAREVAKAVTRTPDSASVAGREGIDGLTDRALPTPFLQRRATDGSSVRDGGSRNRASVGLPTEGGRPLAASTREFFETRLGDDFGDVRIHSDRGATAAARAIGARAFTVGNDVFFGRGQYTPGTREGKELLAHELAHVIQQRERRVRPSRIQRRETKVPLPFLGGSPLNDSAVTFHPSGSVWIEGSKASTSSFPDQSSGTVQIPADSEGIVRIYMRTDVFADNMFINESWTQVFWQDWRVKAAADGALTITQAGSTINPPDKSYSPDFSLAEINPSQGADFVRINPRFQGPQMARGVSVGVGIETTSPTPSVSRPFTLHIEVTDVREPAEPTREQHWWIVYFEQPGQDRVSSAQERQLIQWFEGLDPDLKNQIRNGQTPVHVAGYASTTGPTQSNRKLANARASAVDRILRQYVGSDVVVRTRALGEYQATTEDEVESREERRVEIVVERTVDQDSSDSGEP